MNEFNDFPLTELRSTLLESLASPHHDIEWATGAARRWLSERRYVDYSPNSTWSGTGYTLTRLGEIARQLDVEHSYSYGNKLLGGSPIKGGGNRYGTTVRCRCGWKAETNESAAKGGKRELRARLGTHMAEVGAGLLAAEGATA